MIRYDPGILQKYAEILYRDARFVVFVLTMIFALVGIVPAIGTGKFIATQVGPAEDQKIVAILVAVFTVFVFGVIGFVIGQAIAFWYRLKAQIILCQKQVELNTRRSTPSAPAPNFDYIG